MNIQDALKETGKACNKDKSAYVGVRFDHGANYLSWYNSHNDEYISNVSYEAHFKDDWQPYHPIKEIRPENAGELWRCTLNNVCYLYEPHDNILTTARGNTIKVNKCDPPVVHGEHWKRLYPEVKEGVERVGIDNVPWWNNRESKE